MTIRTHFVTGPTGNVGEPLVRELVERDAPVIAGVREPEGDYKFPAGVEQRVFDYENPETWEGVFDDVDSLFVVRPPAISDVATHINPAIDAAVDAGVDHVVTLSLLGVEKNPIVPHARIEKHVETLDVRWTHLRPSFFMQNLSTTQASAIRELDEILVPAGDGKTSFIDARDIAEVAAGVLTEPDQHSGEAHDLTGSEALDYHQVAEVMSYGLGRQIRYTAPSYARYARRMRQEGHPWGFVAITSALFTVVRLGLADRVTDDVKKLLGRPPRSLQSFVEDHADIWR